VAQEELARKFGELVRRLRLERGLSQEEFAFRVGLHQTYVSRVERGERNVTIGTADRIAGTLGNTVAEMFAELERDLEDGGDAWRDGASRARPAGRGRVVWPHTDAGGRDILMCVPQRAPKLRFCATLGQEPEIEVALV
jgi:transcriptional regulator with XRE-family HTH domain